MSLSYINNISQNENFDLTEILSKIQAPLMEIKRLQKLISDTQGLNGSIKESSSIVLKNTNEIADIVESLLQLERENQIEIILHNRLKFPQLYIVKSVFDVKSDMGDHGLSNDKKIATQEDIKWLVTLEKTILENISDHFLKLPLLSKLMLVSERQLHRRIQRFTGTTPNKYVRELKMIYANHQVKKQRHTSLKELSSAVGFKDPHYFSRLYIKKFGRLSF